MNSRPAFILALGLILASAVLAWAFYASRLPQNTIEATGSARVKVVSDVAKWRGSIFRTVAETDLKQGYAQLRTDLQALKDYLKAAGLPETALELQPVSMEQVYQQNPSAPREQTLRQGFTVTSSDTARITTLGLDQTLMDQGVQLTTYSLEYYVSRLPEMRVELLGQAVKDARRRAQEIAGSDGRGVGALQSARIGVVQVLAPNSVEVSGSGAYDTSTVDKEVMVTVRAEFAAR